MKWIAYFMFGMVIGKLVFIAEFYFKEVKRVFDPLLF